MIEGLKLRLTGQELKALAEERVRHHREREKFYEARAADLEAGGAEARQFTGGDPVRALRESEASHRDKARYFAFFAAHVVTEETYLLTDNDLRHLEVLKERW